MIQKRSFLERPAGRYSSDFLVVSAAAERTLLFIAVLIGYARVSTKGQRLTPQIDALRKRGCDRIFREKKPGASKHRPALDLALASLKKGDVLAVWKLDRLGRSLRHLVDVVQDLERRGIGFVSISDGIDTKSPTGKLLFHIVGAIAEFERSLISERTIAGLDAARSRGRTLGRPKRMTEAKRKRARAMVQAGKLGPARIAARLNVGRTTLWREVGSIGRRPPS